MIPQCKDSAKRGALSTWGSTMDKPLDSESGRFSQILVLSS